MVVSTAELEQHVHSPFPRQLLDPLRRRLLLQHLLNQSDHLLSVLHPDPIGTETLVVRPFRPVEQIGGA